MESHSKYDMLYQNSRTHSNSNLKYPSKFYSIVLVTIAVASNSAGIRAHHSLSATLSALYVFGGTRIIRAIRLSVLLLTRVVVRVVELL